MRFQIHRPEKDLYRYTFLRWHVEAFVRCEDPYVQPLLLSISQWKGLYLADFYGLPKHSSDRQRIPCPSFRHMTVTIRDRRFGGQTRVLSTQELPAHVIQSEDMFAVLGPGGSGKSALLLYLFFECLRLGSPLQQRGFVPCYVRCDVEGWASVQDLIHHSWQVPRDKEQVERNLARYPRCLLLFDLAVGDKSSNRLLRYTYNLALDQLSAPPGHRVVVALRDNGSQMARTAKKQFEAWELLDGWGLEQARMHIQNCLPPEQSYRLVGLLREQPELSRLPLYTDLLVQLVYRDPDALGRIRRTPELLWTMAARILDRELEANWPDELKEFEAWDPANPALPFRPHPVDMLLQELAVEMQKHAAHALPLGRLDQFLDQMCAQVSEGQIRWWPKGCLDLLCDRPPGGMWGLLTAMPLFRTEEGRLLWLHDSFCQAYFLRRTCYDRVHGKKVLQGSVEPDLQQGFP